MNKAIIFLILTVTSFFFFSCGSKKIALKHTPRLSITQSSPGMHNPESQVNMEAVEKDILESSNTLATEMTPSPAKRKYLSNVEQLVSRDHKSHSRLIISKAKIPGLKKIADEDEASIANQPKTSRYAIIGFISSLLGIASWAGWVLTAEAIPFVLLAITFGVLAIGFSWVSLDQIKNQPEKYRGEKLARAGKIIGIMDIAIIAVSIIAVYLYVGYNS